MKKLLIAACSGILFFASCTEVPPDITFGRGALRDTTYMGTVPATTNAHNVLAEEFSGQSCSNCPGGHAVLDSAEVHHPGHVNTIVYYQQGVSPLVLPPSGAIYDFRNQNALTIGNSIFPGAGGMLPSGSIDRTSYLGSIVIGYPDWDGVITSQLSVADSLNLDVSSTFSGGVATIVATITYTKAVSTKQNLSIVVVADSMIDKQSDKAYPADLNAAYMFNDVFVGMVTSVPLGDPILDTMTTKEPGRVVQRVYNYTLPAFAGGGIPDPAHCRVIVFINGPGGASGDYHVGQSAQHKLK